MQDDERFFRRGDVVVHRDLHGGRVWYARAEVIVQHSEDGPLLTYWGPGAEVRAPVAAADGHGLRVPTAEWVLEPRPWRSTHVLSWWDHGKTYSVWLFWEAQSWLFAGWYINLQSPFVRTTIGFDGTDDLLDVWMKPDGTWSWKDKDELDEAVQAGVLTAETRNAIRRDAAEAIEAARGHEPFTDAWTRWRPDHDWPVPRLRPSWKSVALSSWDVGS